MTWAAVLAWALILVAALPRGPVVLLYLFFGFGAFGSLNLLPEGNGVATVLPQAACAVFLIGKILFSKGQIPRAFDAAIDPTKLGLLFAFLFYGLFSAYVMPRFFAHMVEVVEMAATAPWATPLRPTLGNLTQSAYILLSVGCALAFTISGEQTAFRRHYIRANWIGGIALILAGLADMTVPADLLEPFRNAYALLTSAEVMGVKRVVGLMPEASSYGTSCVGAAATLIFIRPCFEGAFLRNYLVPLTGLFLLLMAVLSTSSSAYVGLAVFALLFAGNWLRRALSDDAPAREGLKWEAIISLMAALAGLAVITLIPHAMDPVYDMLDLMVFKKHESDSYLERNNWTKVAMHAFFATYGVGVGIGSVRTSNWFVNILGSTGVIGAALLGSFIVRLYVRRCRASDPRTRELATGLKIGLLPQFAMLALIGTTPDFGVGIAAAMGTITSLVSMHRFAEFRSGGRVGSQLRTRGHPS